MKDAGIEFGFKRKAILISLICFVVTLIALQFVRGLAMNLVLGFIICWSHYHAARQSWGMSSVYRRISGETSPEKANWDRWLFAPIGLVHVTFYFILIFRDKPGTNMINIFSCVSLLCVLIYFMVPIIRERKVWSWARFYDSRLFIYPLALQGSLLVLAIHGFEYLFISKKFFDSEEKNGGLFKVFFWSFLVIFVFFVTFRMLSLDLTRDAAKQWIGVPWLASALVALSLTAKVFHFWADGYMYTRQHVSSRKWILSHVGIKERPQN